MLSVRPGITDLASMVFADEGDILSGSSDPDLLYNQIIRPWKSRLALLYAQHHNVVADLLIIVLTFTNAVSRERALRGVDAMLTTWGADGLLRRMAARKESLIAWPPPGAVDVVGVYPKEMAHA